MEEIIINKKKKKSRHERKLESKQREQIKEQLRAIEQLFPNIDSEVIALIFQQQNEEQIQVIEILSEMDHDFQNVKRNEEMITSEWLSSQVKPRRWCFFSSN
jgi:hypothetical protein